jgi:autotransporter translocation and assembly factor TamB
MTRRLARRLALGVGLVLTGFSLIALGLYGFAQTEPGRAWVAKTAAAALSVPGRAVISVERLEGRLPWRIRLTGVSVRDKAGRWLGATGIEIDWRPLALLSRRLHVTSLRVIDLEIERLPAGAATDSEDGPGGIPSLPVDVTVERLIVEDVRLGPALLGQAASFRIAGEAATREADRLASALVVERTDGVPGRAELAAAYVSRDDRLTLDAQLSEPAGGLIARALDLPGLPAVEARVSGDGPLSKWTASVSVALQELASLQADVLIERRDGFRFHAGGSASSGRSLVEPPWTLLAGDQAFEIEGAWRRDRVVAVDRMWIEGPAARLEADGTLAVARMQIDARVQARLKDPALAGSLAPGATVEGLNVEARAKGALRRPEIGATVSADRLAAPGVEAKGVKTRFTFSPARAIGPAAPRGELTAAGEIDELAVEDLKDIEPLLDRRLTWRLAGTLDFDSSVLEAKDLLIQSGPTRVTGRSTIALATGTSRSELRVLADDLAGLGPLIGIGVQGRGEVDASVETSGFGGPIKARLAGRLREIRLDEPVAQALLAGQAIVTANLAHAPDQPLTISGLEVETPAARLSGNADFPDNFDRIGARYRLTVADANVLSGPLGTRLAGRGVIQGRAQGQVSNPELQGEAVLTAANVEGLDLGQLKFAYSASDLPTTPRGRLDLVATPSFGKLEAGADYVFADPELRLTGLHAQTRGTRAEGTLTLPTDGRPLTGTLDVRAADLGPWLGLVGIDGGGASTAALRLSGDGPRQAADLSAELTEFGWRLAEDAAVQGKSLGVTLKTSDLMGSLKGTGQVTATGVALGDLRFDKLTLSAEGDRFKAALVLDAAGAFRGPVAIAAAGLAQVDAEKFVLEVSTAKGQALGQPVALRRPFSITRRADAFELRGLDLEFGKARLTAEAGLGVERVSAELSVDALSMANLDPLWPMPGVSGELSGAITIEGPRNDPEGKGHVELSDLKSGLLEEGPAFGLQASATWRARRLTLTGRLSGMPEREAGLVADLPLTLDPASLALSIPSDEPMSGRLSWHGQMASIWPLMPLEGHNLTGETDLIMALAGSPARPEISGSLQLARGEYEALETGTLLKNLDLGIDLGVDRAVLTRLTAGDGGSGRMSATGQMAFDPGRGHPFRLDVEIEDFAALRRDDVTAVSDGRLTLEGSLDRSALTGAFETRSVEVRIVDRLPADVVTLDVLETDSNDKASMFRAEKKKDGVGADILLDVTVAMPKRVFVRGRGLDSEWSGDLRVTGSLDAPVVEGERARAAVRAGQSLSPQERQRAFPGRR